MNAVKSKSLIRSAICIGVCVVIFIVACIIGTDYNAIYAGAGSGTDAKLSTMDDMSEMLEYFAPQLGGFRSNGARALSNSLDKYKSVTIYEQSSAYASSNVQGTTTSSGYSVSSATFQREMYMYISEDAVYYKVNATISSDAAAYPVKTDESEEDTKKSYSDVDIDMEVYLSNDKLLLRFNRFKMSANGKTLSGIDRIYGKWGDFSDDSTAGRTIMSYVSSVTSKNFAMLSEMGEQICDNKDEGFTKDGDNYRMKKDAFKSFANRICSIYGVSALADDFSGDFEVDLGNAKRPSAALSLRSSFEKTYKPEETGLKFSRSVEFDMSEFDDFEFRNINNTVIELPKNISTLSAEEYNDIMNRAMERMEDKNGK